MERPRRLLVLNGPNLNLLGNRSPEVYGTTSLPELEQLCRGWGEELAVEVDTFQSNHEGVLIDRLHDARSEVEGIVFNPGALTHYSYALHDALEAIEIPTVELHISDVTRRESWRRQSVIAPACVATIFGRGVAGYRDALRHLVFRAAMPATTISYGRHPDQVADLRIPEGPGPSPVVVLIHGGPRAESWARDLMDGIAVDLTAGGATTWNLEYRRGPGAWETTLSDVAAGIDALLDLDATLDLENLAMVGHSAGAQLALWAAARHRLPAGFPGSGPLLRPSLAVSLAGVLDLAKVSDTGLWDGAVAAFLGGDPGEVGVGPDDPAGLLPIGITQVIAHGARDEKIPAADSRAFAEQARTLGDPVTYLEYPEASHFTLIDEQSPEWRDLASHILDRLGAA